MWRCSLGNVHAQITPQLHNPDGTASYLDDGEEEDEADDYGTVDGPSRSSLPFAIASPGEVVEAECAHHLEECCSSTGLWRRCAVVALGSLYTTMFNPTSSN